MSDNALKALKEIIWYMFMLSALYLSFHYHQIAKQTMNVPVIARSNNV